MSEHLPPAAVAAIDQRIAHGHDVLTGIVNWYLSLLKTMSQTDAVGALAMTLTDQLQQKASAVDLVVIAVLELAAQREAREDQP